MDGTVLVAYATRYGSTQEVAEAVAASLREGGAQVDIQPLKAVKALTGYSAVVMGAPLQMFRWHKDALAFLGRHREALSRLPAAVFALGPFSDVEKEWTDVRRPVAIRVFGGKFDPATLRPPYSLLPAMKRLPVSDIRDWDAIAAWGKELAATFGSGDSPAAK
jgi:menaquinone-dependent protoporphyrinogen oxidase